MSAFRTILGWIIFSALILKALIGAQGGFDNMKYFMNFESIIIVFGGTLLWGWLTWGPKIPLKAIRTTISYSPGKEEIEAEHFKTVLSGMRNAALALGVLGTLLGTILMLGTIDDIANVPKKLALSLTSAFYGIFLAEVIFGSLLAKLTRTGANVPSQKGFIYSFLLLTLTAFFVVLYALSSALTRDVSTTSREGLVITLEETGEKQPFFENGKTEISPTIAQALDKVGPVLKELLYKNYELVIEGHTAENEVLSKRYRSNWKLSATRAENVQKYLTEKFRLSEGKVYAVGYSEFFPAALNDSEENRRKNRRVEFFLKKMRPRSNREELFPEDPDQ